MQSTPALENCNIVGFEALDAPQKVHRTLPLTPAVAEHVLECRTQIKNALHGVDHRPVIVVGPCSIHDAQAAYEYAERLAKLRERLCDHLNIVMRVYFEKPRTTIGWKGFINDPHLDGTNDISTGLRQAREILLHINQLGLPCATEFLDPIVPQYIADLISWVAIGARTTESQTHREMASGLSMPVGFKNATDGGLQVALDAMISANHPHSFLGIDAHGCSAIVRTSGNADVHLVLRGGGGASNCSPAHLAFARVLLEEANIAGRRIMVDCSHGNSQKDYRKQPAVFQALVQYAVQNPGVLLGMMLESHLVAGNQPLSKQLRYGQSITDGCIDWEQTETILTEAARSFAAAV